MSRAIFIDIDGTLRNSKREVTKETIEAVKKMKDIGINIILCSGRPRRYVENIAKTCLASKYIISLNGAEIYDYENDKIIYSKPIEKDDTAKIYNISQKSDVACIMNTSNGSRVTNIRYEVDGTETVINNSITEFLVEDSVNQCTVTSKNHNNIARIIPSIEKMENVKIINRHKSFIEESYPKDGNIYIDIVHKKISKGTAIEELCKYLQIDLAKTIGIGDSQNDIEMLETVSCKVAMGNATEYIKKISTKQIDTNDNNGVAKFLEEIYQNTLKYTKDKEYER